MTNVTELAIVKRIMAKLQLGEAGKLGAFFGKQVKNAEKAIRDNKRNKTTLENRYNDKVEDLQDKLEDAKEALSDAYENVTPEDVKTNAAMAEFESVYWGRVAHAKAEVERIEKEIKTREENHSEEMKAIDEQIARHKERIDVLSKIGDNK